jgi:hypothetical protein
MRGLAAGQVVGLAALQVDHPVTHSGLLGVLAEVLQG